MNIYSVYCNAGRYDLNALVQARNVKSAKKKVGQQAMGQSFFGDVNYRVKRATLVNAAFIKEMDLQKEVRALKRGGINNVVIYDEGT